MQTYYKTCRRCRTRKPVEEFQPKVYLSGRRGWRHICTECKSNEGREINSTLLGNRKNRSSRLKHRYGITLDEYEELAAYQEHVCAICDKPCNTGQPLSVDHCHETKAIRGLLCRKCNVALGSLNTIELLQRAIDYLKKS